MIGPAKLAISASNINILHTVGQKCVNFINLIWRPHCHDKPLQQYFSSLVIPIWSARIVLRHTWQPEKGAFTNTLHY